MCLGIQEYEVCTGPSWFGYVKQEYCILDAAEAAILRNISDYHISWQRRLTFGELSFPKDKFLAFNSLPFSILASKSVLEVYSKFRAKK